MSSKTIIGAPILQRADLTRWMRTASRCRPAPTEWHQAAVNTSPLDLVAHFFRERDRLDGLGVRRRALLHDLRQGVVRRWQLLGAIGTQLHRAHDLEEGTLAVRLVPIPEVNVP